jgi:uncharacterized protein YbaR (Trm112 family)
MHILLTDVVTCPRCGPEFGLIVLADQIEDRRVLQGQLGCPNCREEYPVAEGVADLRWPRGGRGSGLGTGAGEEGAATPVPPDPERPYRLAALLGITGPAGPVVIVSDDPQLVGEVDGHLPDAGVVGVSSVAPHAARGVAAGWVLAGGALPFRSRAAGGVVLATGNPLPLIEDALRCLSRGARIVIDPAPTGSVAILLREGAELLLEQEEVAVASDPRAG